MNKIIAACVLPLLLTACFGNGKERPVLTKTVYKVVEIDDRFYECDDNISLPNPDTMTNEDVSKLINDLVKANKICGNNMRSIKAYTEMAKKVIEERNED